MVSLCVWGFLFLIARIEQKWDGNYANGWDGVGPALQVKWPLSLVFSTDVLNVYTSIFQVLLKLLRTEVATTQGT